MTLGLANLGDGTAPAVAPTPPAVVPVPGFTDGLSQWWNSPVQAVSAIGTALQNTGTSFSGDQLGYTLGLFVPPLAILAVLFGGAGRKF